MSLRGSLTICSALACAAFVACTSSTSTPAPEAADAGTTAAALPALGANDVSVLVPLPKTAAAPDMLAPTSAGTRGVLLPQAVYDKIPKFGVQPVDALDYARMRVVAIRFDGCFPGKNGCDAQIRLVMQPIDDTRSALDSAIHLFYRLTEPELAEVVTELRKLRELAPEQTDGPLDVSPPLRAQGLDGPYGAALKELVLKYAGEQVLVRMTFFLRAPPLNEEWFLGGFDRDAASGAMQQLEIVGVGKGNQRVNRAMATEGYSYSFTPAGKTPEDVTALLDSAKAKTAAPEDVKKAFEAFLRIENPTKYGPDQLPCAGCHVSTVATEFAKTSLGLDPAAAADAFTSARDLTLRGQAAATPSSLRGFGWFEKKAMIGRRVANETAAVVDDLEKRFPAR